MNDNFPAAAAVTSGSTAGTATGPALLPEIRRCEAGAGSRWLSQAWTLFKARPGLWLAMSLTMIVIAVVLSMIPGLNFLLSLGFGAIAAGWLIGAYELDENQDLQFAHLFAGFSRNLGQQLLLGLLYLAAVFVVVFIAVLVALIFGGISGGFGALMQGHSSAWGAGAILGVLLGSLVAMALIVPVAMAIWFAPALIAFNDMPAFDAMKLSFKACLANIVPFLIYGLVLMVLAIIAAIPLGLGFIVLLPIIYISYYTSYREVLTQG